MRLLNFLMKLVGSTTIVTVVSSPVFAHGGAGFDIHSFYLSPVLRRLIVGTVITAAVITALFMLSRWTEVRVRREARRQK